MTLRALRLLVLVVVPVLLWVPTPLSSQESGPIRRVWKDRTGKFRVEATLEGVTATVVQLKRIDNDLLIEVPLDRLSEEDVAFVRSQSPPEEVAADPETTFRTASALEAAARKRRYALGVGAMYQGFLADPGIAENEKESARAAYERWKPLVATAKVRCGTQWYTPAELADLEDDERQLLERADQQLDAGDAQGVAKTLQEAAKLHPGSIRADFYLGVLSALHPRGRSAGDAQAQFLKCVRRLQDYGSDLSDLDRANLAACYNNLALASIRERKAAEAIGHWEKCLRQGAAAPEVLQNFGHLQSLIGQGAAGRRPAMNSVYLSQSEKARFDALVAKAQIQPQSHDASRGWRYMRLAKAAATAPDSEPSQTVSQPVVTSSLVKIAEGTGFVIGKNHIATNRHVVTHGAAFKVRFEGESDDAARAATVELVSKDSKIDLAALRCADLSVPPLAFNAASARLSQELRVLGFPAGSDLGATIKVSRGIVSALPPHRGIHISDLERAIFHDAATDAGSSGGPVCDAHGSILGVHFAAVPGSHANQYKACVPAADAVTFFQPRVPDLTTIATADSSGLDWEAVVDQVRKSTVQIIVLAEPDRFQPKDNDLGVLQWDPYDDPWCMACYGLNHLECPVRGCSRGTVGSFKDTFIPNGNGVGGRIQRTPIRVTCKGCGGKGRINCEFCEYGLDPRFVTALNRAWLRRYVALRGGN